MAINKIMSKQLSIFLEHLSLDPAKVHYMKTPAELIEDTILKRQGVLADTGALCIDTGKFTGRSPKDRFIVRMLSLIRRWIGGRSTSLLSRINMKS